MRRRIHGFLLKPLFFRFDNESMENKKDYKKVLDTEWSTCYYNLVASWWNASNESASELDKI